MKELLKQIRDNNILLEVVNGKLQVFASEDGIHPGLLSAIKERKEELLQLLSENGGELLGNGTAPSFPVTPDQENYPLSSAQRRLWLASQVGAGSRAYHVTKSCILEGAVDEKAFAAAFSALIRRHESLRTVFKENGEGVIRQWILSLEASGFQLLLQDLRAVPQPEMVAAREIQQLWTTEFDLSAGPLIRCGLFRLADQKWVLSYVMHHIISDGWSVGVLLKELLWLYQAGISGQLLAPEPLPVQYRDYAVWQQAQLQEESLARHRAWWLQQFEGELPVLALPLDAVRPSNKSFNGGLVCTAFPKEIALGLKELTQQLGTTLFSGLLSSVYILLYRYTGQEDIVIGSPIAGREHVDLEGQIGFYVNTLALRNRFSGHDDFKKLLNNTQQLLLEAYQHQSYPFDELVVDLDLQRDMSRNVLFDVMVALQNAAGYEPQEDDEGGIVVNSWEGVEHTTSKFDLSLVFIEQHDALQLNIEYDADIFKRSTIVRMACHLQQLIAAIIASPAASLLQLDYLGPEEKEQLLEIFNDQDVSWPQDKTIIELFEEQVSKTPDNIALTFETIQITYTALNETANRLANFLRMHYRIQPDDLVAIQLPRSEWMVIAMLGVLKAGGAYVPVDPDYPADRIAYMIEDSGCSVVIDEEELQSFQSEAAQLDACNLRVVNKPADLAYVIYTSGTTGKPKGSLIEHRNVVRLFKTSKPLFDFTATDVWTLFHSCCFDFSVWEMYGALLFGGRLIVIPLMTVKDPAAFVEVLSANGVTVLNQTPAAFYNLINAEKENGTAALSLRYVIFGGEALSPARLEGWHQRYPQTKLINMYGITETTVHVTYKEITAEEIRLNSSSIGKPIPTLSCYVLDTGGNLLPAGIPGELCVGGAGVSRGYLNREELTARKFIDSSFKTGDRLYRSGDLARLLETGEIEYLGRIDSQVKIRGHRVEPAEIEAVLQRMPGVEAAVVLTKPGKQGETVLIAYLLGATGVISGLRDALLKELPGYMIPSYFVPVAAFPVTANGKVDKKRLPDPEELALPGDHEYVAPRNEQERILVSVIENITGRKGLGIKDNFFAAGGDSIKAITFVVQVKKQLGYKITIKQLYEHPVIEELSGYLTDLQGKNEGRDIYDHLAAGHEAISRIKAMILEEDREKKKLPAGYEDIYPVVPIEQGMIFSSLMNTREPVYYDQYSFVIHIDDINLFMQGLQRLVQRHPMLRTRYFMNSFSQPVKVVMAEGALPLHIEDLSPLSKEEKADRIRNYVEEDLDLRLSFDDELLWRIRVFHLEGTAYCITYSFHHAMLDGWSVSVFKTELANYRGEPLPPLKHSYKDYCALSLGRQQAADIEQYWSNLLQGYTRNKLPFNYKGLKIRDGFGMRKVQRAIDLQLLDQLNKLAARHHLSFKAICLAAHVCLLHIICSEQDVTTGVVTHERPGIEDGENILGCFLTTVPVRVLFDTLTDLLSLLNRTQDYITGVKAYEVHLSDIARYIGDRTSFGNPVFDTLLNYTDFHRFEEVSENAWFNILDAGKNVTGLEVANEMTNTLFDVEVGKTTDTFTARIKYAPGYFHEEEVRYALDLYVRILESFVQDVHTPLASLNILTEQERQEVLVDFNATEAAYAKEMTLDQLFEEQVHKTPQAIALKQDGTALTYAALNEQANQLAACLLASGVKAGDNIGLHVSRSFDMIIGMYGILKTGAAYVPIDPEYPADRQEYIARNSGVTTVVSDAASFLNGLAEGIAVISLQKETLGNFSKDNPAIRHSSRELAYTIYTSGSTGKPKGVMIEHHSAVNLVAWVNDTFQVGAGDRLLFITSMCFDLSVYDVFGMLAAGGTVVIARNEEIQQVKQLKKLLKEEQITFWDSVPTTMNYLISELEAAKDDFLQENLRLVFMSGDWIPVNLPDRIRNYFPKAALISLGGATEATVWSNYFPIGKVQPLWSSIPYGRPITNNTFYILDDHLQPVPKGVTGELYIGGVGVARGYANDPEKTAASFKPDPFNDRLGGMMYKTGDLGRMMPDGNMEFLGRKDNQVKIRGFRVELGEIESVLQRHEKIRGAIVDVFRDASNQNQLCAYLVQDGEVDLTVIREFLKEKLPAYMVPGYFMTLEAFPLTSNGKINRKALPRPAENGSTALRAWSPPVTETQVEVEKIWRSILHTGRIGIHDDLFELGANSLSVGAFVNRVQRELNLTLNIRNVFIEPTIEAIAGEIEKIKWASGELFKVEDINDTENFRI